MNGIEIQTVNTRHDIGLVTAARLVAIFWAGLVPLIFPVWLIIRSEIFGQNIEQDKSIARAYVTRSEFEDRMKLLDERAQRNSEVLREIREEETVQRQMLEKLFQQGRR